MSNMLTNSVEFFRSHQYRLPKTVMPPIIIAWQLRTPENYGNLIRLADTIGALEVLFIGEENNLSDKKIRKTAGNSYQSMKFSFLKPDEIFGRIPEHYSLVALETESGSENIFKTELPKNMALIIGNEKRGVDAQFLEKCNKIVHIPLTGPCTSLNVTHAAAIAMFEWLRQIIK